VKPAGISGIKGGNMRKTKLTNLQQMGTHEFMRSNQPTGNIVDNNGDLLADSHNILKR
jgi:hypothetical protein